MKNAKQIAQLLGDRVLLEKLELPERRGSFYFPQNYRKQGRGKIWWGKVEAIGLDSKSAEWFDLKVGDIVGVDVLGDDCLSFMTEDGKEYKWVPDEFIAVKNDEWVGEVYQVTEKTTMESEAVPTC